MVHFQVDDISEFVQGGKGATFNTRWRMGPQQDPLHTPGSEEDSENFHAAASPVPRWSMRCQIRSRNKNACWYTSLARMTLRKERPDPIGDAIREGAVEILEDGQENVLTLERVQRGAAIPTTTSKQLYEDRSSRYHHYATFKMGPLNMNTATATATAAPVPEAASTTTIPTPLPTLTQTDIRTLVLS